MSYVDSNGIKNYRVKKETIQLQRLLDEMAEPAPVSSAVKRHCVWLDHMNITRRQVNMLVEFLNHEPAPPKIPTTIKRKWDDIDFYPCTFAQQEEKQQGDTNPCIADEDEGYCSLEDKILLASTVATRADELCCTNCPVILECLFHIPRLEVHKWTITQGELSTVECARVGNLIQNSVNLRSFKLATNCLEDPLALAHGLANAFHIESFLVQRSAENFFPFPLKLSDAVVRGGWNGIVGRLLQCRLKSLSLDSIKMDDSHFKVIVQMLPTSQLERLAVTGNRIGLSGVLDFAQQLPRIKFLKYLYIGLNPWADVPEHCQECYTALTVGLIENHSIEWLYVPTGCKDKRLLDYSMNLNRAGRRILATSHPVPSGLWPLLLERAWRYTSLRSCSRERLPWAAAESIHFFLQCHPLQSLFLSAHCPTSRMIPQEKSQQL